ncbi:TPR-like protein [Mycena belliarum]|uniref:TPR-like protein n=1 Tax=Mycena belliarum TaxID=1033014 RepID=A0AAD6UA00_9AGAR|nr:TPR-like protein [Mycena belliae]
MFKPGDKLNPYDPAALDHPAGQDAWESRLRAGTSPMTPNLAKMLGDPATSQSFIENILKADAAERERTGETVEQQMLREKREWAVADAKSAELKIQGNDAFKIGDYKAAFAVYTACIHLSSHEPLYSLNRAAVALKLKLYETAVQDASDAIDKGNFHRAKAHFRRGQAKCFLGDWNKAEEDYNQALKLQPGDRSIVEQIAELKRLRGLSTDKQSAWISAHEPAKLSDIFESHDLKRRVEELLKPSAN